MTARELRYWSMYATSTACGYLAAAIMAVTGQRWKRSPVLMIRVTAIEHAEAAARKQGPYLAPVTLALALVLIVVVGWWLL